MDVGLDNLYDVQPFHACAARNLHGRCPPLSSSVPTPTFAACDMDPSDPLGCDPGRDGYLSCRAGFVTRRPAASGLFCTLGLAASNVGRRDQEAEPRTGVSAGSGKGFPRQRRTILTLEAPIRACRATTRHGWLSPVETLQTRRNPRRRPPLCLTTRTARSPPRPDVASSPEG